MAIITQDWLTNTTFTPKVDETREFLEIATDFANPLDIVREAISNAYDANCSYIRIHFEVIKKYGENLLKIILEDDGEGMNEEGLEAFFNLGMSPRREQRVRGECVIGEKGHGTKIYFNSDLVEVTTTDGTNLYHARMDKPYILLHEGTVPTVQIQSKPNSEGFKGTKIEILGYNRNRRDLFDHDRIKDHILWFTKHGSIEKEFGPTSNEHKTLYLKGLGQNKEEFIQFGHPFPPESKPIKKLFDEHLGYAPDFYCRKWIRTGYLPDFPEIEYHAVFYVEGDKIKREHNPMLRRQHAKKPGAYKVQERYGLWVCKDFIPIQRKNEWITTKGSEFTRFHAFVNCQELSLTANRGSVENTPAEKLANLEKIVKNLFNEIRETDDWADLDDLTEMSSAYETEEKERKDYDRRNKKAKTVQVSQYKGFTLVEPRQENGVYAIVVAIQALEPNLFPFEIVDYDTHNGIDVLAKTRDAVDVGRTQLRYIEFKHTLKESFNHSFQYIHSIVCWRSQVEHDQIVKDIRGRERKLIITPKSSDSRYTQYMLDDPREAHKI